MNVVDQLEGLQQSEDFAVATLDRYVLLVWRRQITAAGARAARDAMTRLYEARPFSPLGFITLIEEGCSLNTSAEVREILAGMLRDHNYVLGATAVAYERPGFVSAIVRSVITAINVASRAVFRTDVSARLDLAVRFITHVLDDHSREKALFYALASMRRNSRPSIPRSGATFQELRVG
jgi:hypothetical protein